jgi:hypothetical protein
MRRNNYNNMQTQNYSKDHTQKTKENLDDYHPTGYSPPPIDSTISKLVRVHSWVE